MEGDFSCKSERKQHGNNTKNKRQHRADEQFEIRQSKGNLMVTDETSDETDVNNLPVQGKPSVFPVCDFTFLSYSPYFLRICRNRNDSLKQQAKLCLCEDWLCWLRFFLKSKLTSFSCVLESRTFFLGKKGTHGGSQIKSIVEWDGLHHVPSSEITLMERKQVVLRTPIALHCGSFIFNMAVKRQNSAHFDWTFRKS